MKRTGAILFWVGLVITIVSVAVAIFSGVRAVDTVSTVVDQAEPMPSGSATVQLNEGDQRTIYEQTTGSTGSAVCEVSGPGGSPVNLSSTNDLSGSAGDVSIAEIGSFQAPQTGAYQVDCTGGTTLIGPSLDFGDLGSGALSVLGGILGVGLGLLLLVLGAVLWFVGRSKAKTAAASGPGDTYGPGGYDSGGYYSGGYNSGGYDAPPPPGSTPPPGPDYPPGGSSSPGHGSTPPPPPPPRS